MILQCEKRDRFLIDCVSMHASWMVSAEQCIMFVFPCLVSRVLKLFWVHVTFPVA